MKCIEKDASQRKAPPRLIFLGDYIDRGPDSAGVVNFLLSDRLKPYDPVFLLGNHEFLLLESLKKTRHFSVSEMETSLSFWLQNGGWNTLASYGLSDSPQTDLQNITELASTIGSRHMEFYETLHPCFVIGDYYFVHAGINPDVPLNRQKLRDQIWIRDPFLLSQKDHGKVIVHGHTPCGTPEKLFNRIGIDTGAVYGNALTAVRLEEGKAPVFLSVNP